MEESHKKHELREGYATEVWEDIKKDSSKIQEAERRNKEKIRGG
jgi:hypothetical protein